MPALQQPNGGYGCLARFLHHAEIIEITGRSYRLKDKARQNPRVRVISYGGGLWAKESVAEGFRPYGPQGAGSLMPI